jgi:hypothetical protein
MLGQSGVNDLDGNNPRRRPYRLESFVWLPYACPFVGCAGRTDVFDVAHYVSIGEVFDSVSDSKAALRSNFSFYRAYKSGLTEVDRFPPFGIFNP